MFDEEQDVIQDQLSMSDIGKLFTDLYNEDKKTPCEIVDEIVKTVRIFGVDGPKGKSVLKYASDWEDNPRNAVPIFELEKPE